MGTWLTNDIGESRNWQMYFAADGLVKTYAAPRRPLLCNLLEVAQICAWAMTYVLEKSMASSMLVTAWTSRQPSCTLRRRSNDFLPLC